jgi:hypothetical protein
LFPDGEPIENFLIIVSLPNPKSKTRAEPFDSAQDKLRRSIANLKFHLITLSARASTLGGIVTPI